MSTPIPQKDRPIGIVVLDAGLFGGGTNIPIPWFTILYPRPEDVTYTYPSRGTVVQTFDGGFLDDFGLGVADINITGHTGWRGGLLPGELMYYNLRDLIILRYHALRKAKADAGLPIDSVKMYLIDTLQLQVWEVYPMVMTGRKNKQRPLLYQYQIRFSGLNLLIGPSLLNGIIPGIPGLG